LRILLTGATGLIGSAVLARLQNEGHEVVAVVCTLDQAARRLPASDVVALDLRKALDPNDGLPHLGGMESSECGCRRT
jgi:uncharacterized protein YbjT (DUF2867 family)